VITKKRNFHHIKRRTLVVKYRLYFFDIGTTIKLFKFEKHKNQGFETTNFLRIINNIKKIKMIFHR